LKKVVAFLEGGEKGGQEKQSRKAVKKIVAFESLK
jgi:hypothetical protein